MFWPRYHIAFPLDRRAFTMVELLIVVAILAILVAVLLGVSNYVTTQNNTALTRNCLDILDAAIGEFHAITGHYPVDDWDDIGEIGSLIAGASWANNEPVSDQLLYLQLSLLPQTREIIAKLPDQLITAPLNSSAVQLANDPSSDTPYLRSIVDAWSNRLHYRRNNPNFPWIWSNGPDGENDNRGEDDITNAD